MISGTIYAIKSAQTQKYYIGSTLQNIKKRLCDHRRAYNRYLKYPDKQPLYSSFEIMKYDDCYIEQIEEYKCDTPRHLKIREGVIQKEHINDIVNKTISGRTITQYKLDNKEILRQYRKNYNQKNYEKRKLYNKETKPKRDKFYIDNKQTLKDKSKQYYHKNKKVSICVCGGKIINLQPKQHLATAKHKRYLEATTNPI